MLAGFWSGGFEGADHVNAAGLPLDMVRASGHLDQLEGDHARAAAAGFCSVRESIGWRLTEDARGVIDLDRAQRVAQSASRHGLQVVWTLMHYGVPDGLSLHDDALIERFARFAHEVALVLGTHSARAPVFNPINEISFLAWAASQPHLLHPPHNTVDVDDGAVRDRGYEVKCRLVRAALLAMRVMKEVEPRCLFIHAEPLVHVVAPRGRLELEELAQTVCGWQWQAWDLLVGKERPDLGGHADSIDVMGVNHYHNSQWELETGQRLDWHARDPRRQRLCDLLQSAWKRYGKPLMLAETSHVGGGRARWLHEMAGEVAEAQRRSVPVEGLCLYPMTDRPDWNEPDRWHRSGLWHVTHTEPGLPRTPEPHCVTALKNWQQYLPNRPTAERPLVLVLCHRPWGIASHRTRQLMEHVSQQWRVVWLDEPFPWDGAAHLATSSCGPTLELLTPHVERNMCGTHARGGQKLTSLVLDHLGAAGLKPHAVWLTEPTSLPLALAMEPACLVYEPCTTADAHDHWHAQALEAADVVVAADEEVARACRAVGSTVHRIDSGVNLGHFQEDARDPRSWAFMEACALQGKLPRPLLGFAGTIDARLDISLIIRVAQARPCWHFVMVGPVRLMDWADLPRRANITWLGEHPPELLPTLMSQWNLAWVPWRTGLTVAGSFPDQVLEFLASGLAVVSQWIDELVPLAPAGVRLARNPTMLLHCCELALAQSEVHRSAEQRLARQFLRTRSWEACARRAIALMHAHIDCSLAHIPQNRGMHLEKSRNVVRKVA